MFFSYIIRRVGGALGIRPGALRVLETIFFTGVVVVLAFVGGILSARILGPEGRGELTSIIIGLQVAGQLAVVGLPSAIIYNVKKTPAQTPELVGAVLTLAFVFGIASSLIGVLIIPYWLENTSEPIIRAAQIAMLATPMWTVMQVATPILRAKDEFDIFNGVRVATPLVTAIVLGIYLLFTTIRDPIPASLPYVLNTCIFVFWPLWWIWKTCQPRFRNLLAPVRTLLQYGLRSLIVDTVQTLSRFLDRIVLVYLLPPAAVGLYVVAVAMARAMNEMGMAIALVLFPKASGQEATQAIAMTDLAARIGLFSMLVLGLPMLILADFLIGNLFGHEFLPAVSIFQRLLIAVILGSTCDILSQAFFATGKPETASILRCIEMVALVGLLFFLAPRYGMDGASFAVLASSVLRFIATLASYPLVLGVSLPRLYINRSDIGKVRKARSDRVSRQQNGE
ncbi:MAG: oligosaccharide flippase family protein [Rhodospirillales bacterium]|nr:oligosaccharide flippase family protein [Rhodospirillales bacterium]